MMRDRTMHRLRALVANPAPLLFATAVVVLIALSSWWYVFLGRAVETEFELRRANLVLQARLPDQIADRESLGTELRKLEQRRRRRELMILGEGLLLSGLLLAVVGMLYRLVRSERRFRTEMEGFLRRVTHEMKTPLAGIKAVLQTIELGRVPAEQVAELCRRALREAEREEQLIQNLLLAQRMRQPGAELRAERIDLAGLASELVLSRQALESHVNWAIDADEEIAVHGDPSALRTVLDNLLDNAAKYGAGSIRIALATGGKRVTLQVIDDGIGFSAQEAAELFEPFVRSADSRSAARKGTGLGLAISRTLAEKMGGSLHGESEGEGRGATFSLTLPAWRG